MPSLPAKVWQPGVDQLEEGEELQFYPSPNNSLHVFHIGRPWLSFDVLRDYSLLHCGYPGEKKCLNSELWHACAGPFVLLPALGNRVVYFPQGHSEQVAASTNKEVDAQIPDYPG